MAIFTWKMPTMQKQMKNQSLDFYFRTNFESILCIDATIDHVTSKDMQTPQPPRNDPIFMKMRNVHGQFSDIYLMSCVRFCIQQWLTVNWGLKEIFFSDANQWGWGFNLKAYGIQGCSLGFFDKKNSKVVIITWKIRNVLKRMKNQFSDI